MAPLSAPRLGGGGVFGDYGIAMIGWEGSVICSGLGGQGPVGGKIVFFPPGCAIFCRFGLGGTRPGAVRERVYDAKAQDVLEMRAILLLAVIEHSRASAAAGFRSLSGRWWACVGGWHYYSTNVRRPRGAVA